MKLTHETIKYFSEEALEQLGNQINHETFKLAADFVMDIADDHIIIEKNEKGRRCATRNGEKMTVAEADKILYQYKTVVIDLTEGNYRNLPDTCAQKIMEAIEARVDQVVTAKKEELAKDPLIGKTIRLTEKCYGPHDWHSPYRGANRGTILTIDRREIDGYVAITQKKKREVMIPNHDFNIMEVIDSEAVEVSQPETSQPAVISPDNDSEQLSISEGFFNAHKKTSGPIYLRVKDGRIFDHAHRQENLDQEIRGGETETREVIWCEEFETNPEDWEGTDAYDKYQRSHEKGYPAVDIGEPWSSREPEPWLAMIEQLKSFGLPLIYTQRTTAWATELGILQNAGYTLGRIIDIESIEWGGCSTEKAIEINY